MSEGALSTTQMRDRADAAFKRGDWASALADHLALVRAAPSYTPARFRVADCLLNLGHREKAKAVYRGLAWHHIRGGRPLSGLVATKMLIALDPELDDILNVLAELYAAGSERVGDVDAPSAPTLDEAPVAPVELTGDDLHERAAREAAETEVITEMPMVLPPIPLFSHLEVDEFRMVLESLRLRRYSNGEAIIREGEIGDSFFMLADGEVTVSRGEGEDEVLLARLHRGAVFGEMALMARIPRVATVRASGEVDALELERSALESHAGQLESVRQALRKFTRGRLLANLAATSPLFESLTRSGRRDLMGRFRPRRIYPGDVLIEQGEPGRGLFLIASGQVQVAVDDRELARLGPGEVFGEISLLHDSPTTATVRSVGAGEVLFLLPSDFAEVLASYPAVAANLRAMSAERLAERAERGAVLL